MDNCPYCQKIVWFLQDYIITFDARDFKMKMAHSKCLLLNLSERIRKLEEKLKGGKTMKCKCCGNNLCNYCGKPCLETVDNCGCKRLYEGVQQ